MIIIKEYLLKNNNNIFLSWWSDRGLSNIGPSNIDKENSLNVTFTLAPSVILKPFWDFIYILIRHFLNFNWYNYFFTTLPLFMLHTEYIINIMRTLTN